VECSPNIAYTVQLQDYTSAHRRQFQPGLAVWTPPLVRPIRSIVAEVPNWYSQEPKTGKVCNMTFAWYSLQQYMLMWHLFDTVLASRQHKTVVIILFPGFKYTAGVGARRGGWVYPKLRWRSQQSSRDSLAGFREGKRTGERGNTPNIKFGNKSTPMLMSDRNQKAPGSQSLYNLRLRVGRLSSRRAVLHTAVWTLRWRSTQNTRIHIIFSHTIIRFGE